jgi:hypothetical protein
MTMTHWIEEGWADQVKLAVQLTGIVPLRMSETGSPWDWIVSSLPAIAEQEVYKAFGRFGGSDTLTGRCGGDGATRLIKSSPRRAD